MNRTYKILKSIKDLSISRVYAIDLETTGLNPRKDTIVGCSISADDEVGFYTTDVSLIQPILEDETIAKIFHNAVFDIALLKVAGYEVKGKIYDTMILAQLYNSEYRSLKLKILVGNIFHNGYLFYASQMDLWLKNNSLKKDSISKAPIELLQNYAIEDALNTFALFKFFIGKLRKFAKWQKKHGFKKTVIDYYHEEQMPIIPIVIDMTMRGIKVDLELVVSKQKKFDKKIKKLRAKITKINACVISQIEDKLHKLDIAKRKAKNKSGKIKTIPPRILFNWNSDDHLRMLLVDHTDCKLTKKTKKAKKLSVDAFVLEELKDKVPWLSNLLELRKLKKLKNTYLNGLLELQEGGIIHANFNITGTKTGRFSSNSPNVQNLPKEGGIKQVFIPRTKYFIYADYSQLELRLAAHESQDKLLLKAYRQNRDLHQETANFLTKLLGREVNRDDAKTLNFAAIYNCSGWRAQSILKITPSKNYKGYDTSDKGDAILESLFARYKGLRKYLEQQKSFMLQYHLVVSHFGRIRRLSDLGSDEQKKFGHAFRAGFNDPIQGFGASICKRAMIALAAAGYSNFVNQVHDSITLECENTDDATINEIREIMENVVKLSVSLKVDIKLIDSLQEKEEKS